MCTCLYTGMCLCACLSMHGYMLHACGSMHLCVCVELCGPAVVYSRMLVGSKVIALWPRIGDSLRFSEWSSSFFPLRCKVWCQLGRHGPHSLHSHFCRQLWAEAQLASCVPLPTLKCTPPLGPCQNKGAKKVRHELHGTKHGYLCDPMAFRESMPGPLGGLPLGLHFGF